jgi:hypothetical protein
MAFSELELAGIRSTVGAFVDRRQPPPELRDKLRFELEIDGHAVTIWEVRPAWLRPRESRLGVARFRFTRTRGRWTLYWMRADLKWHSYCGEAPAKSLAELVHIVDEDASFAFFG